MMEADPKNKIFTPQELKNKWKRFKIVRNAATISFLMVFAFAAGVPRLNIDRDGIIFGFIIVLTIAGLIIFCTGVVFLTFWPCPRCSKFYCSTWGINWPFLYRCRHCGLPFGSDKI